MTIFTFFIFYKYNENTNFQSISQKPKNNVKKINYGILFIRFQIIEISILLSSEVSTTWMNCLSLVDSSVKHEKIYIWIHIAFYI